MQNKTKSFALQKAIFSEETLMPTKSAQKRNENSNIGIFESDSQTGSLSYYGYFSGD
jgi:hypothetical protein